MTLLVLCVDRDNDFGDKAGVQGPIVGREANREAATELGLADPEDSDTNSVFGAINLYDEVVAEGEDAEIVTLTGDRNVGPQSDRVITRQLDQVLEDVEPGSCLFVTDGAEDEYVLPIVTSRVRVEAVHRVIVRQNADIEGTYYVIKRALEDEKMQRTFLMPLALGLLVYGIFAVWGTAEAGLGAISLTLGTYFLVKVLHLESSIRRVMRDIYTGLTTGKVSLFTSLLSILVLLGGAITAAERVLGAREEANLLQLGLMVGNAVIWWIVVAGLVAVLGKAVDGYFREDRVPWGYWMMPFSLVALGFILQAALDIVMLLTEPGPQVVTREIILFLVYGFTIAFIGTATNTYVKENFAADEPEGPVASRPGEAGGEAGDEQVDALAPGQRT